MKQKMNKKEYSKRICTFSLFLFTVTVIIALICSIAGVLTEVFAYIVPAVGAIAAASVGFYFNKAKAENLSKQKIRNVVLKLALEKKLGESDCYEILEEVENIDATVDAKLASMYEEAVNEAINIEI